MSVENLAKRYKPGSMHRCRVIGFNVMDDVLHVSTRKEMLRQPLVSVQDAQVGQKIKVVVKAVRPTGVVVTVHMGGGCSTIRGLIPPLHVSDAAPPDYRSNSGSAAERWIKFLSKRFPIGETVSARVLRVDKDKNLLLLTAKPSLLAAKYPPVTSYADAAVGQVADGVVVQTKDTGILVSFFDNVRAWLHSGQLAAAGVVGCQPQDAFLRGQILRVVFQHVDADQERIVAQLATA
jgi:rRNA biogenesis protein RRP5